VTDVMSPAKRRALMQRIRSKNTKPELIVRKALYARKLRYRLHAKISGARPDLVFGSRRIAIFVHGCFWHGHECHLFKWPKTRVRFWKLKILGNRARDQAVASNLQSDNWCVATIWECGIRGQTTQSQARVFNKLERWIRNPNRPQSLTIGAADVPRLPHPPTSTA
jgi:DNA mismatch endonuclease (patch repair protein)